MCLEPCDKIDASRKLTFNGINKDGKATELTLPGKQKWPTSVKHDSETGRYVVDTYERVKVCMVPQFTHVVDVNDQEEVEAALDTAALMPLPCPAEGEENPFSFWFVN